MAGEGQQASLAEVPIPTDSTTELPFETSELRKLLEQFLNKSEISKYFLPRSLLGSLHDTGASIR